MTTLKSNSYDNWIMPSLDTMQDDFDEYKHKEFRKWKIRAEIHGLRFPIFETFPDYAHAIQNGKVIEVTDRLWDSIVHLSNNNSISDLKSLVRSYTKPRDVNRIVSGFNNNGKVPYPVILKGKYGMHIMSGNTRLNAARIMGFVPKALLVDVTSMNSQG